MDRMRTMLFCPASQPKMFLNAPVFHPDAILFDLEDAVAYAEKDSARDLLCEAMAQLDFLPGIRPHQFPPHAFWRGGCAGGSPGGHPVSAPRHV